MPGRLFLSRIAPALALIALAACAPTPAPTPAVVRVAATDLAAPLLFDLARAYGATHPDVTLVPSTLPLSAVEADLGAGNADLALLVTRNPDHFATPLGYVTIAVIVNPANPVASLSAAQVREVFAGRIDNWGQVGGAGADIQVIVREELSDAAITFETSATIGAPPTPNAIVAPTWEAMREAVSGNPGAIGYLPAPELDATVKAVETRHASVSLRALIVAVATREPTGPARDFLAWAQSEEGQKVAAEKYGPIR